MHKCIQIVNNLIAYKCRCGIKFICVLGQFSSWEKPFWCCSDNTDVLCTSREPQIDPLGLSCMIKSDQNTGLVSDGLCVKKSRWESPAGSRDVTDLNRRRLKLMSFCLPVPRSPRSLEGLLYWNDFTEDWRWIWIYFGRKSYMW